MAAKRKSKKSVARKRTALARPGSSLEELARAKMPKWRVATDSERDSAGPLQADAVSPNLEQLRSGITGPGSQALRAGSVQQPLASPRRSKKGKRSGLVKMVPESDQDARLGAKTQVFEDDEHTGSQG